MSQVYDDYTRDGNNGYDNGENVSRILRQSRFTGLIPGSRDGPKKKDQQKDDRKWTMVKIIRYVVYGWMIKLGGSLLGVGIPLITNICEVFYPSNQTFTKHIDSIAETSWIDVVKSDFSHITTIRELLGPHLIKNVPMLNQFNLRLAFQNILPNLPGDVRTSTEKEFVYFTPDRPWVNEFNLSKAYSHTSLQNYFYMKDEGVFPEYPPLDMLHSRYDYGAVEEDNSISDKPASTDRVCRQDESDACKEVQYMYAVYPDMSGYIDQIAPSISHLVASQQSTSKVSLWMASPSVTARMHYDMEDNFLLQVSGTKTILVLSPEAHGIVQPYSSLHPYWRQSRWANLTNMTAIQEYLAKEAQEAQDAEQNGNDLANVPETRKGRRKRERPDTGNVGLWKVTLAVGDMLYLPAGYFHSVVHHADSVSVNTWLPSTLSEMQTVLDTNIQLPFRRGKGGSQISQTLHTKLSNVGWMIRQVLRALQMDVRSFGDLLRRRHRPLCEAWSGERQESEEREKRKRRGTAGATATFGSPTLCTMSSLAVAEAQVSNRRIAGTIASVLGGAGLSPPLLSLLLGDYVEDILHVVLSDQREASSSSGDKDEYVDANVDRDVLMDGSVSHPCTVCALVEQCVDFD